MGRHLALSAAAILWLFSTTSDAIEVKASERRTFLAQQEGYLTLYTNTHRNVAQDLLDAFHAQYPGIRVDYNDMNAAPLSARFIIENSGKRPTADLVWSSAMDLQVKLINDGYAQTYLSSQRNALQPWALWHGQGYGVSSEPVVFVYNKRLLSEDLVPRTHAELEQFLHDHASSLRGKVATYDPMGSEVGMLFLNQDIHVTRDTWNLVRALGATKPVFYINSGDVIQHIAAGDQVFGYNVMGSYALEWQKKDPDIGVVFPSDYILLMSRIAFIPVAARHPNAARLFLDFLLSRKGQQLLSRHSMMPIRKDVPPPKDEPQLDRFHVQAIQINAGLLGNLDRLVRIRFERDWARALDADRGSQQN